MSAIPQTCEWRPLSAKTWAARMSVPAIKTEGPAPMMSQPLADVAFSDADRVEVGSILSNVYRECLLQLRSADRLREAAGIPLPEEAASLYAYLLPLQTVSR